MPNNQSSSNNQTSPWYRNGLRFCCTQCGNCCTGAPGVVWVSDEETRQIADYLDKSIGEIKLMHTRLVGGRVSLKEFANGDCTFFDARTRRCKIYPVRPVQCQTWPFWPSNLTSKETWREIQQICPGSSAGEFVSLEEIENQASKFNI